MDLKGLAWIGNIYEKFEAMCLEMEEVMYQLCLAPITLSSDHGENYIRCIGLQIYEYANRGGDTVKYVDNQAQTVGANIKRFYSEVMQDLHPHSCMGPVKLAAADLSLDPYAHPELKHKAISKKDPIETDGKLVDESKVISGRRKTSVYKRPIASRKGNSNGNDPPALCGPISPLSANISSLSSSQRRGSQDVASGSLDLILPSTGVEGKSFDAKQKISHRALDSSVPIPEASVDSMPSRPISSVLSTGPKKAGSWHISSTSLSTDSSTGTCTSSRDASQTNQTINGDAKLSKSVVEEVTASHKERLDDSNMDAAKNYDIIDKEVEIEQFNESAWAETCVLVEGEKLHCVPAETGSHKSYKKKLREAFSTKLRSTRKEYEQLAAKYKEQKTNKGNIDSLIPAQAAELTARTSPAPRSESEWELL